MWIFHASLCDSIVVPRMESWTCFLLEKENSYDCYLSIVTSIVLGAFVTGVFLLIMYSIVNVITEVSKASSYYNTDSSTFFLFKSGPREFRVWKVL